MKNQRITIFGGSGFLGRHLVKRLADRGAIVRVAVRDPEAASFLKPLGNVGQIVPFAANLRDPATVAAAVDGADAVVNLVGILYEKGKQTFDAVLVEGAATIARAAKAADVKHLVHVSALGASAKSAAKYARSKAAGEAAVQEAFPEATILRPSVVFGPEDDFFNKFAAMTRISPVLPILGTKKPGGTKFQPVYVGDVAEAIVAALTKDGARGMIYELGGPKVMTSRKVMELILEVTGRRRLLMAVPLGLLAFKAWFLEFAPKPLLTRDQVKLLQTDNVVAGGAHTFAELGIKPAAVEAIAPTYLARYRPGGRAPQLRKA